MDYNCFLFCLDNQPQVVADDDEYSVVNGLSICTHSYSEIEELGFSVLKLSLKFVKFVKLFCFQ